MTKKRILALLLALTMMFSSVAVFASLTEVSTSPTAAGRDGVGPYIRKALQMPFGTAIPDVRFDFNFEFVSLDGSDLECDCPTAVCEPSCREYLLDEIDVPETVSITFPTNAEYVNPGSAGGFTYVYAFADIGLTPAMFPSTGVWVFKVSEEATAFMTCEGHYCDAACDPDECKQHVWGFDTTEWYLVVSVGNHVCVTSGAEPCTGDPCPLIGTRIISGIIMFRTDDADTDGSPELGGDNKETEIQFLNQFVKYYCYDPYVPTSVQENAALFIEKQVLRDGDRSRLFRFTLDLHLPVFDEPEEIEDGPEVPDFPFTAVIRNQAGDVVSADPVEGPGHVFYLRHNERLYIAGIPIGTTYDLVEDYIAGYTADATVVSGDAPCDSYEATFDNEDEYLANIEGALISNNDENVNSATVYNDRFTPTPTGVFLSNLPFIGLIVLAGGALVGFIVLKVRSSKKEEFVEIVEVV